MALSRPPASSSARDPLARPARGSLKGALALLVALMLGLLLWQLHQETRQLEDAQRLIIQGNGARHQQYVVSLVEHQRLYAIAAEQGGQRGADGAVADDQYIYSVWQRFLVVVHV